MVLSLGAAGCALLGGGCGPLLPDNRTDGHPTEKEPQFAVGRVVFSTLPGVYDSLWAEIPRSNGDGTIGAYVSTNISSRNAWILLLDGAATVSLDGNVYQALYFQDSFGKNFQQAGFRTVSLVTSECGGPYGQQDLLDVIDAVDWLQGEGRAELQIERLYVVGYSMGGMLSNLLNRYRTVDAVVSISSLAQPDQFEDNYLIYRWITDNFRTNEGICQLKSSLEFYGPPGSPGWDHLDCASRLAEMKAPMLLIHGERDFVLPASNTRAMQRAYEQARADGQPLQNMEFLLLDDVGHFTTTDDPRVAIRVIEFIEQREIEWLRGERD